MKQSKLHDRIPLLQPGLLVKQLVNGISPRCWPCLNSILGAPPQFYEQVSPAALQDNAIIKPLALQQVFQVHSNSKPQPNQSINQSLSLFSIDVSKPNRGKSSSSRSLAHSLANILGHLHLRISSVSTSYVRINDEDILMF